MLYMSGTGLPLGCCLPSRALPSRLTTHDSQLDVSDFTSKFPNFLLFARTHCPFSELRAHF